MFACQGVGENTETAGRSEAPGGDKEIERRTKEQKGWKERWKRPFEEEEFAGGQAGLPFTRMNTS